MDPSPTDAAAVFLAFAGAGCRLLQHPVHQRFTSISRLPRGLGPSRPSFSRQRERRIESPHDPFRKTSPEACLRPPVRGSGFRRRVQVLEQLCFGRRTVVFWKRDAHPLPVARPGRRSRVVTPLLIGCKHEKPKKSRILPKLERLVHNQGSNTASQTHQQLPCDRVSCAEWSAGALAVFLSTARCKGALS